MGYPFGRSSLRFEGSSWALLHGVHRNLRRCWQGGDIYKQGLRLGDCEERAKSGCLEKERRATIRHASGLGNRC